MKKISNKQLQAAILRGAVAVSGCTFTAFAAIMNDKFWFATMLLGAMVVTVVDNNLKSKLQ